MANFFIGISRGQSGTSKVTASTATAGTDFELRIDSGKNATKEDVILAMKIFEDYILSNGIAVGKIGTNLPTL